MPYNLTNPPTDGRASELWLQHAAGYIIFEDIREYAIDEISIDTDGKTKKEIIKVIDDAVYGLMLIMDGVTGSLRNKEYSVTVENVNTPERNGKRIREINTLTVDDI